MLTKGHFINYLRIRGYWREREKKTGETKARQIKQKVNRYESEI